MRRLSPAALLVAALACRSTKPVDVGVAFTNSWRINGDPLTAPEQARIKETALATLDRAFDGFNVRFTEGRTGDRLLRVEDTPDGPRLYAAGLTYPASTSSSVRFDILYRLEMMAVHCQRIDTCGAKTRAELVDGLGRGVGATAAHELGHQAGLGFSHDARCDDCYDGDASASYAHFFAAKHWSAAALAQMRRTISVSPAR